MDVNFQTLIKQQGYISFYDSVIFWLIEYRKKRKKNSFFWRALKNTHNVQMDANITAAIMRYQYNRKILCSSYLVDSFSLHLLRIKKGKHRPSTKPKFMRLQDVLRIQCYIEILALSQCDTVICMHCENTLNIGGFNQELHCSH